MDYVRTTVTTDIPPGVTLELTPGQAATRRTALKPAGGNRFTVLAAVQFKRGEAFGIDGDLGKDGMSTLERLKKKSGQE